MWAIHFINLNLLGIDGSDSVFINSYQYKFMVHACCRLIISTSKKTSYLPMIYMNIYGTDVIHYRFPYLSFFSLMKYSSELSRCFISSEERNNICQSIYVTTKTKVYMERIITFIMSLQIVYIYIHVYPISLECILYHPTGPRFKCTHNILNSA